MRTMANWREVSEHEIGRPHLSLKNPVYQDIRDPLTQAVTRVDVKAQDLYDFMQIEVNTPAAKFTFFAIPQGAQQLTIGGVAPITKQLLHTNVSGQGQQLPNPQAFMIKGLQHVVRPDIVIADFQALEYQSQISLDIGDNFKNYWTGLLARVPSGCGVFGSVVSNPTQGWPDIRNVMALPTGYQYPEVDPNTGAPTGNQLQDEGVGVNPGQNFRVISDPTMQIGGVFTTTAAGAPGGTGVHMWFYLVGVLRGSVG